MRKLGRPVHVVCLAFLVFVTIGQGTPVTRFLEPLPASTISNLTHRGKGVTKGRLQVGVRREFDEVSIAPGSGWQQASNGTWYCLVQIESAGALGLRLHLEQLQLSAGSDILVYSTAAPDKEVQRIDEKNLPISRELWTGTMFSQVISVLCEAATERDVQGVRLKVSEISHIYALPTLKSFKEGACENDVTCYPEWANTAAGVARMMFVDQGSTFLCTGCLIASTKSTSKDYFLTARHCITSQSLASTLELYWFYQTSACNGNPPALDSVPHTTGGASLLASGNLSDFAFLQLKQRPPAGTIPASWTTAPAGQGNLAVTIHHPDGSFKRISAGTIVGSDPNFWDVQWFSGVTEHGSSGSPLFNGNHEIMGQLTGGFNGAGSSCDNPSAPDEYGRFDATYESIKSWIGGGVSTNGFVGAKEGFTGLYLVPGDEANPISSGAFMIRTTKKGNFSGKLQTAAGAIGFRGTLDVNGAGKAHANRGNSSGLDISFQVDAGTHDTIAGTVTDGSWTAALSGQKSVYDGRTTQAPEAGKYTLSIAGNPGTVSEPGGAGLGTVIVSKAGQVRGVGALADDTKFVVLSDLSSTGVAPMFVPLYSGKGCAIGWIGFQSTDTEDFGADVHWSKGAMANAKTYPGGFVVTRRLSGNAYAVPPKGSPIVTLGSSEVVFEGADLQQTIVEPITVDAKNRVSDAGSNQLSLVFKAGDGTFTGKITDPQSGTVKKYNGAVMQKQNGGAGYFVSGGQSGRVRLD